MLGSSAYHGRRSLTRGSTLRKRRLTTRRRRSLNRSIRDNKHVLAGFRPLNPLSRLVRLNKIMPTCSFAISKTNSELLSNRRGRSVCNPLVLPYGAMKGTTKLLPVALVVVLALALSHVAWLPAYAQQTERAKRDRKSTRLNSSHVRISYAVFCLKKKRIRSTS